MSEIVANAVNASTKDQAITLTLFADARNVLVMCFDEADGMLVMQSPTIDQTSGRRLVLVEALSENFLTRCIHARRESPCRRTVGTMNEAVPVVIPSIQADALAQRLRRKGLVTTVYKTGGHQPHPCVRVASSPSLYAAIIGYIYAAPDGERWWFCWSSLEPIEPITNVEATADRIVQALGFPR